MTVLEYLKVVNGVDMNKQLTPNDISVIGFIDIKPKMDGAIERSKPKFNIIGNDIVVSQTFGIKNQEEVQVKATFLEDDISFYCSLVGTPEQLLEKTINALKEYQADSFNQIDYQPGIELLKAELQTLRNKVETPVLGRTI